MTEKFIAIITARGGSKRLPNKNILDLAGQPLISWTIEAAKNCDLIQGWLFLPIAWKLKR